MLAAADRVVKSYNHIGIAQCELCVYDDLTRPLAVATPTTGLSKAGRWTDFGTVLELKHSLLFLLQCLV